MIELYFEKLSRYDRKEEICSAGIPFKMGTAANTDCIRINDGEKDVPCQAKKTAQWSDGSVKWACVTFKADLPGNAGKSFYLFTDGMKNGDLLEFNDFVDFIEVNTGKIKCRLNKKGKIFRNIEFENKVISEDEIEMRINGKFEAEIENGWEIAENGAVKAVVEGKGRHFDKQRKHFIDFIINISFYKDKEYIKLDYRIINKEKEDVRLDSIEMNFKNKADKKRKITGISNYRTDFEESENEIYKEITAEYLLYDANEHFSEVFYGTFFGDRGGVCATIYQAQQNYPKALFIDNKMMSIQIIPKKSGGICFKRGMAKENTVFLHFHNEEISREELNIRSLQFQYPDRPVIESSVYKESNVFPDFFLEKNEKINDVEKKLIMSFDTRGKAYGMLNWGDIPDMHYTSQGRGNGELVWGNNEYDYPHAAMTMYAICGERRFLDSMLVTARHWMDIDICHYSDDEYRLYGAVTHSAGHVSGNVDISHEWVEGLLDYYHVTGERFAYEAAIGTGNNIIKRLTLPKYHQKGEINARETGWALRALAALYKETNDDKWLRDADFIIGHFEQWKNEYNGWLSPYTDHTTIRVPFMISIAVASLMRYYEIKPMEKIKDMIIDAVDDMVENCIAENGLFYYKELPSLKRMAANTTILEALTAAYKFTGDKKYIEKGIPLFKEFVYGSIGGNFSPSKAVYGDAVVSSGPGGKGIAQAFYPVMSYYTAAVRAKIKVI